MKIININVIKLMLAISIPISATSSWAEPTNNLQNDYNQGMKFSTAINGIGALINEFKEIQIQYEEIIKQNQINQSTQLASKSSYAVSSENGQVMLCNQFTENSKNTILVCSPLQDKEQLKNLPKTVQTFSEAYRLRATLQKAQDFFKTK